MEKVQQRVLKQTKYISGSMLTFIKNNYSLMKIILYGAILVLGLITSIISFFKTEKIFKLVRVVLYCFIALFLNYISFFLEFTLNKLSPQNKLNNVIEFSNWIFTVVLLILIIKNLIKDKSKTQVIANIPDKSAEEKTFVSKIAGFFAFLFIISLMIIIISIDYFYIFKNIESISVLIGLFFIIICVYKFEKLRLFTIYIAFVLFFSLIIILVQFIQRSHTKKVLSK